MAAARLLSTRKLLVNCCIVAAVCVVDLFGSRPDDHIGRAISLCLRSLRKECGIAEAPVTLQVRIDATITPVARSQILYAHLHSPAK